MNTGKRFFIVLSVLVLLSTSILPITVSGQTIEEKANALHQLGLLADTAEKSYLNDRLSRAHAAAFIVRLTGKEEHVIKYAEIYSITSFPDVNPTQWYAKYVGYCAREKIIVGTTEGKFEPDGFISEKSFLRLVLSALGYVYNVDYPLEEVYAKAYSVGLVTDPSYYNRTADNANYTRGQAVDVLHNALKVINKNTGREMFYSLIEEGVFTRQDAIKTGLIYDAATTIEEIKALDFNKVYMKLNEYIAPISNENIIMYVNNNENNRIECSVASLVGNELVLNAPNKGSKNIYNIKLLNVEDENGNITSEVTGQFSGYEFKTEERESDYFRIKSITGINEKSVRVQFTHPVNENTEMPELYHIFEESGLFVDGKSGSITVRLNSTRDGVILTLNNKGFSQNDIYSLSIDGELTSAYGVKLNDGTGDSMDFVVSSEAVEPFGLNKIITLDNKTLLLDFNTEINPFLAAQIYNFYIVREDGTPVKIAKTVLDKYIGGSGNTLLIIIDGTFAKNKNYIFTINNLSDVTRQQYITEKSYDFTADYGSSDVIQIKGVRALDSNTVEVVFNLPPNESDVIMTNYYTIRGNGFLYVANPEKIFYDPDLDLNRVKLYLPSSKKLEKNKEYTLTVDSRMQDFLGNTLGKSISENFYGVTLDTGAPTIYDAVTISRDAIKLTFNREIALDAPNILTGNYVLEYTVSGTQYRKLPLSVTYIDARTIILKFDSLVTDEDASIVIKYNKLKDYSGAEGTQGQAKVRFGDK